MGVNLARELADRQIETVVFDRRASAHWPATARVIIGDLASPPDLLRVEMEGAAVFHLAGSTRPAVSTAQISKEIASSIGNIVALLEWSRDCRCKWVFASSGGTVYGEARTPTIDEDHPTNPMSSYGIAKLAIEKYFHLYGVLYGVDYVIARIANPFGLFQMPNTGQGLVATLLGRVRRGEAIEIWGDGENVRDYLYIADTVDALLRLAEKGSAGGIYNVGSGTGTSINELITHIAEIVGRTPLVKYSPARGIDVRRNVLDARRLIRDTGWRPRCDF
jgi:UDP-glucose 4-epimerase